MGSDGTPTVLAGGAAQLARLRRGLAEWFRCRNRKSSRRSGLLTRFGQVQQDPNVKEEDHPEGTDRDGSEYAPEPAAVAGKSGGEGRDRGRGRHAAAHEGRRAHGDPLRPGALSEGRGQGQRRAPDDGAHEPADGLAAPDSETAGREDEQGRDSGGVARRHPGPHVLGGSAGVGQEERSAVARGALRASAQPAAVRGSAARSRRQAERDARF